MTKPANTAPGTSEESVRKKIRRMPFYLSLGLTAVAALLLLFVKERPREGPSPV